MIEIPLHEARMGHRSQILPDLSILREGGSPPPTFPLSSMGAWQDWIKIAAEAANAPPDYVAGALLAAASAVIGNARWAEAWPGWAEPPILWVAALGKPSSSKSPAADRVFDAVRAIQMEEFRAYEATRQQHETQVAIAKADHAQWEQDIKAARAAGHDVPVKPMSANIPESPPIPQILVQDATSEAVAHIQSANPRGTIATRDELAGWIRGMNRYGGDGDRQFWLEAYGGRSFRVDRKNGKSFTVEHLSCAIHGSMQPEVFARLVAETDDDGLTSRMLYFWPDSTPFIRPTMAADGRYVTEALGRLRNLQMSAGEQGPCPRHVRLSEPAAGIFEEWCRERSSAEILSGSLYQSWSGKGRGHVLRIALVLELLDWSIGSHEQEPLVISDHAVMRAIGLYDHYLAPMALRAFGAASLPQGERDATSIAKFIRSTGKTVIHLRNDIYRARIGGIANSDQAQKAAQVLIDAGWLLAGETSEKKPGRPKQEYRVNPALWSDLQDQLEVS